MNSTFVIVLCFCALLFSEFSMCNSQNLTQNEEDLLQAAEDGNEKVVEELLRVGTNVNIEDRIGWTPLKNANKYGHERVAELLIRNGANASTAENSTNSSPLYWAVSGGNEKVVELVLRSGANIGVQDKEKWTVLHFAAERGYEKVAEVLIGKGANISAETKRSSTPLHLAAESGHEKVVELLLKSGANINAQDKLKWTPLLLAGVHGFSKVVELLVRNGADVNIENFEKYTILQWAVQKGPEYLVEYILQNGANVNAEQINKSQPLHLASQLGREHVVNILLQYGANIYAQDKNDWTALHFAVDNGHEQTVLALIKHGASRNAKTADGKSPLDIAISRDKTSIVDFFKGLRRYAAEACQKYRNLPTGYILGGTSVESKEFPWMAALGYFDFPGYSIKFACGGTVISDHFVLTAAHCVRPSNAPVVVRLGKLTLTDTDDADDKATNHQIKDIFRHPGHSILKQKNDIALIRLMEKISFSDIISPACLQTELRDGNPDVKMIVTGWGKTSAEGSSRSNVLLKAQVETVPLQQCNEAYLLYNEFFDLPAFRSGVSQSQYCAYDPQGRNDSCQGDSGGPLQYFNESNAGIATIVGIVSFGIDCGAELLMEGYVNI